MAIKEKDEDQPPKNGWVIDNKKDASRSAKDIKLKRTAAAIRMSELEQLLKRAWRDSGKFGFLVSRNPNSGVFKHHPIQIDALNRQWLEETVNAEDDWFFACAEFSSADSRKNANVHALCGFHVDLDCGAEKAASGKGYADWKAAREAVYAFCEKAYLPAPNVIVQSGGGIHCYWHLQSAISPSVWKEHAVKFKAIARALNFLADPSRTSDAASLMRAPGSFNLKYVPPRPVEILEFSEELIVNDQILKAIENAFKKYVQPAVRVDGRHEAISRTSENHRIEGVTRPGSHSLKELAAMVNELDPDMDYQGWFSVLSAIHRETGGNEHGFDLANAWSARGQKYKGDTEIRMKWNSLDGHEGNPITVGTIKKMLADKSIDWMKVCAATEPNFQETSTTVVDGATISSADTCSGESVNVTPHPLSRYSLTGTSGELKAEALAQVYVLQDIGLSGQFLAIYAKHNTGKTVIVLKLLINSIQAGRIKGEDVCYLNLDDTHDGLTTKTVLAERHGFHMLSDGYKDFDARIFREIVQDLVETDRARGNIVVLDTLKKFTDTMDKRKASAFMKQMRQFIAKGGTIIALAHVNKNPGADGRPVYSGTTDIVDDADCAYVVDTAGQDEVAMTRTVEFRNIKRRGNVRNHVAFRYSIADAQPYELLLNSVEKVEDTELVDTKQAETAKNDSAAIAAIVQCIREGITSKIALKLAAAQKADISHNHALQVIERYTGSDPAKHRWNFTVGARGVNTFTLLEVADEK